MNSSINDQIFDAYLNKTAVIAESKQPVVAPGVVIEEKKEAPCFDKGKADRNKDGKVSDWEKKVGDKIAAAKCGKKGGKAKVKESVKLTREGKMLRENFRSILQKNGLTDLVTPRIIKSMFDAFNLGTIAASLNESKNVKKKVVKEGSRDYRKVKREELKLLTKKLKDLRDKKQEVPSDIEDKVEVLKTKLNVVN